jgi:hypothetical protein
VPRCCAGVWAAEAKIGAVGVKGGRVSQIRVYHTPNHTGYAIYALTRMANTGDTGLFLRVRITEYTGPYAIRIRLYAFTTLIVDAKCKLRCKHGKEAKVTLDS